MNSAKLITALVASIAGISAAGAAHAQSDGARCLDLARIDHSEVVDDQTILFHMRSGDVYRNTLDAACPGLDREQTFMYRVTLSRICEIDVITVLQDMGFGFMPGASCTLGDFEAMQVDASDDVTGEPIASE